MSTRGFVGKKEKGKISGCYNHSDSYYSCLGKSSVETYFNKEDFNNLGDDSQNEYGDNIFLYDGLYCEYGYVHNLDNDTLEIYRGFFKKPQIFEQCYISSSDKKKFYTHLVTVIDKQIHTEKQALAMMTYYDKAITKEIRKGTDYPERDKINICDWCFKNIPIGTKFCSKKCERNAITRIL